MNKRKLKQILDRHEMRTNANRAYSLSLEGRVGKLEESLKALTLRVDALHVEEAREALEREIGACYHDLPDATGFTGADAPEPTIIDPGEPTARDMIEDHDERIKALEDHFAVLDGRLNLYSDWLVAHDKRLSAIEQSIAGLQHAACETARMVLEKDEPADNTPSCEYHEKGTCLWYKKIPCAFSCDVNDCPVLRGLDADEEARKYAERVNLLFSTGIVKDGKILIDDPADPGIASKSPGTLLHLGGTASNPIGGNISYEYQDAGQEATEPEKPAVSEIISRCCTKCGDKIVEPGDCWYGIIRQVPDESERTNVQLISNGYLCIECLRKVVEKEGGLKKPVCKECGCEIKIDKLAVCYHPVCHADMMMREEADDAW